MSDTNVRLRGIVESLLFVSDQPLSVEKISEIVEVDGEEIKKVLEDLENEYKRADRGYQLREVAGGFRMNSHPAYSPYIEKLLISFDHRRLTQAALETLSIIAYKQPVTKADIGAIRGVNSDGVINTLLNRDLIKEEGKQDTPGQPILYGTSTRFMESFGMRSLAELPPLDEFNPDEDIRRQIEDNLRTQAVVE
ncbi:MAG: SMC-Scp complex subunit ScpB [Actinobacteria bacterium]|uniref:Segregation and condensation protein B n=1 Tax=Candidatus Aquicultor primus TaxID=1797195 RepID=A0A1F2UMC5_9ACTN|nr:SMC-Scp complex subunit ScpB [Actinomycetota bacterium]OFW34137.1 MAG: SMC-Scp complex subunit ScpB [Candidatus Aquicultor primus]